MDSSWLSIDSAGILRGACGTCRAWQGSDKSELHLGNPGETRNIRPGVSITESQEEPIGCRACGRLAEEHEDLSSWLGSLRNLVKRTLRCGAGQDWPQEAPSSMRVPVVARQWSSEAAALHLATNGEFRPPASQQTRSSSTELVSVLAMCMDKNSSTHPLLYRCFCEQTHGPLELVVVHTGVQQSEFFLDVSKKDSRVTYLFFECEEHGAEQEEDPLVHVHQPDKFDEVLQWVEWTPDADRTEVAATRWPRALKRNIGCAASSGSVLVHFNEGDIYSASYISTIAGKLLAEAGVQSLAALPPHGVALSAWHGLELSTLAPSDALPFPM